MTERTPGGRGVMDLEVLARDDVLLDALGRGQVPRADDDLAAMLAAWQADIADGAPEPAVVRDPAPVPADATLGVLARTTPGSQRVGLYIHVPFCTKRCHYCSFNTAPLEEASEMRRYVRALALP